MNLDFSLILTCTIDPKDMSNLVRSNRETRLNDYKKSFNFWVNNNYIKKIILIENSNSDLTYFNDVAKSISNKEEEEENISKKKKNGYKVKCSFCNINTTVPFVPDFSRPIFCPKCLKLSKEGKIPSPNSIKKVLKKENKIGDNKKNKEVLTSLAQVLKKEKENKIDNNLIKL